MQENPISNSLSKTDSNEASNPIRSLMPFRYGPLCYAIVDVEIGLTDHRIHDIGALRYDGAIFHKASKEELLPFLERVEYLCGHNIIHHDAKYLFEDRQIPWRLVDTLYLSPLLFPERPYHRLVKDDKLLSDQMNNPVNDCEKARDLLLDEMARWDAWPEQKRRLFTALLRDQPEFDGFLDLMGAGLKNCDLREQIATVYRGRICQNVELEPLIEHYPCELAYALALIDTTDHRSITPGWVLHNYPSVEFIIKKLRYTPCLAGCTYCNSQLDVHRSLKSLFGYNAFRTYEGEPLQERAAQAAVEGRSLLAIFPTGGGKSLTFQLPALMAGLSVHGLTVVISVADEGSGGQPRRTGHHRGRHHQRHAGPYHTGTGHRESAGRNCCATLHLARDAPLGNDRTHSPCPQRRPLRHRRGPLLLVVGTGFPGRLPLYRPLHSQIPAEKGKQTPDPGLLLHGHGQTEGDLGHPRLLQTDVGSESGALRLESHTYKPELLGAARRQRRREIPAAARTHCRLTMSDHRLCFANSSNPGVGVTPHPRRLPGPSLQRQDGF